MKGWMLLIASALYCLGLFAQGGATDNAKVYYDQKKETVDISVAGKKLAISQHVYEKKVYEVAMTTGYLRDRVHQGHFSPVKNIRANVSHLQKKGKYKRIKIEGIEEKASLSGGSFYDNSTYFEIEYPNIQPGSYSELEYDVEVIDPHFLRRFYFSDDLPVKAASYTVTADDAIELGWQLFGRDKDGIKFSKASAGGSTVYTWTLDNSKAHIREPNSPGFLHDVSHIVIFIKKYDVNGTSTPVLGSAKELLEWYHSLIDEIKPLDDEGLVAMTKEITEGASTDLEKATRIFHWVQDHIRYVAFEDGWRGFIPYPATEILEKRYGDCKDMTHLMQEMMEVVNVKAEHTWVGTRKLPYRYEETPCLSVDNHLILSVFIDGQHYILDATDLHTPFGVPTTFILSKEVLFRNIDGNYKVYKVPEYEAEDCVIKDEFNLLADGDKVLGSATKNIETFEYTNFLHAYGSANVERDRVVATYLEVGQNNFELTSHEIKAVKPRAKKEFVYSFSVPGYIKTFGESSYLNLNLTSPHVEAVLQADRVSALTIEYKTRTESTVTFTVPEGKTVVALPAPNTVKLDVGSYSAEYTQQGNKITYTRIITIDTLLVSPAQFDQWNEFLKGLQNVYGTTIEYK
jgi:hypothetical protein